MKLLKNESSNNSEKFIEFKLLTSIMKYYGSIGIKFVQYIIQSSINMIGNWWKHPSSHKIRLTKLRLIIQAKLIAASNFSIK